MRSFIKTFLAGASVLLAQPAFADPSVYINGNLGVTSLDASNSSLNSLLSAGKRDDNVYFTNRNRISNFGAVDPLYVNKDTLLLGGNGAYNPVFLKATCQTYSEGDEGGTCFEFDNMFGDEGTHRNGAGAQDSINVGMIQNDPAPYLTVGGNTLTYDTNGNVTAVQNSTTLASSVSSGDKTITVTGAVSCGSSVANQYCDISGSGLSSTKFTNVTYNQSKNTSTITFGSPVTINISSGSTLIWHVYDADGVARGAAVTAPNTIRVYPALSANMKAVLRSRMSVYTNYANGMAHHEHTVTGTSTSDYATEDAADLPNYYYGFYSGNTDTGTTYTTISLESTHYPGTSTSPYTMRTINSETAIPYVWPNTPQVNPGISYSLNNNVDYVVNTNLPDIFVQSGGSITGNSSIQSGTTFTVTQGYTYNGVTYPGWVWIHLSKPTTADISGQTVTLTLLRQDSTKGYMPTNIMGDKLDQNITYVGTDGNTYPNTNYHAYPALTLFFGLTAKSFNSYALQRWDGNKDAITRDYDNEWDFGFTGDHDYQIVSRGLTMSWVGSSKRAAKGSWMIREAGDNSMPMGVAVDGVFPDGGINYASDAGFSVIRNTTRAPNSDPTKPDPIVNLGTAASDNNTTYKQLSYYRNRDDGVNTTFHLGLQSLASANMQYNYNPACSGCTSEGQIFWNAPGNTGGISFGSGIGSSIQYGLHVKSNGTVLIPSTTTVNGTLIGKSITIAAGSPFVLWSGTTNGAGFAFQTHSDTGHLSIGDGWNSGIDISGPVSLSSTLTLGNTNYANLGTPAINTLAMCLDCYVANSSVKGVLVQYTASGWKSLTGGSVATSTFTDTGKSTTQAIEGIGATGTTLATAYTLTDTLNTVSTASSSALAVKVTTSKNTGDSVRIFNRSGVTLSVFPPDTSSQIESSGAGNPLYLVDGTSVNLFKMSATQWRITP